MDRKAYDYGFRAGAAASRPAPRLELHIRSLAWKVGYVQGYVSRLHDAADREELLALLCRDYAIPADALQQQPTAPDPHEDDDED